MTTKSKMLAGLLLAFLVLALPLSAATVNHSHVSRSIILQLLGTAVLFGAAGTVTYRLPAVVAGTATAPTAAQVTNAVVADVTMADASTITTVVHSLAGVSTNGADGSPFVHVFCLVAGATPVGRGVTVSFTTNGVQLANLTTAAGNGQTYRVQIWRHSLITNYTK